MSEPEFEQLVMNTVTGKWETVQSLFTPPKDPDRVILAMKCLRGEHEEHSTFWIQVSGGEMQIRRCKHCGCLYV